MTRRGDIGKQNIHSRFHLHSLNEEIGLNLGHCMNHGKINCKFIDPLFLN